MREVLLRSQHVDYMLYVDGKVVVVFGGRRKCKLGVSGETKARGIILINVTVTKRGPDAISK